MSAFDRFGLISGVIGLIADIIALSAFFLGVWQPTNSNTGKSEFPALVQILIGLTIIYGWFIISVVLIRRSYLIRRQLFPGKKLQSEVYESIGSTVRGIGLLVFPIF